MKLIHYAMISVTTIVSYDQGEKLANEEERVGDFSNFAEEVLKTFGGGTR